MKVGMEVDLGIGYIVLDMGTQLCPPPLKGAQQPPTFRPMSIVAKWSPISALVFIVIDLLIKKQLTEEITVLHPEQESALLTR